MPSPRFYSSHRARRPGFIARFRSACRCSGRFHAFLLLLCLVLLSACRPVRYVPVVMATADTTAAMRRDTVCIERTHYLADSTAHRDSVYVLRSELQVVDTAGRILRTDRTTERYELHADRRYTALRDSYARLEQEYAALVHAWHEKKAEPYPVERELTASERLRMKAGSLALPLMAATVPLIILLFYRKRSK